ncbi:MAG TPA: DMT family transporter [Beijerinckiaceae bacterium]|nr:DMT family transporter [Beijerinckiaceae bacterium]
MPSPSSDLIFRRTAPALFVFLWSTGWIVARYSAEYADPLTFLSARYACAGAVLFVYALIAGGRWPARPSDFVHAAFSGVLLHAIYLGGVWIAIAQGVPASISALLAALQPILTAALAPILLRERIGAKQWLGIVLGFIGIIVVLSPKLAGVAPGQLGAVAMPLLINIIAMLAVTAGTFYQKRYIHSGDLRTVTILQYAGAIAVTLPVAYLIEPMRLEVNATTILIMLWSVLAISIGAIALLLLLIRRGEVSRAAQLIYLVPPTAAAQAYLLFGEQLTPLQLAGMALTVIGVALASRAA